MNYWWVEWNYNKIEFFWIFDQKSKFLAKYNLSSNTKFLEKNFGLNPFEIQLKFRIQLFWYIILRQKISILVGCELNFCKNN